MNTNTKERNEELRAEAAKILEASGADVNQAVEILPLAKLLAALAGCHIDTAKTHMARAVRLARGKMVKEREWGGTRPGAGRPARSKQKPEQRIMCCPGCGYLVSATQVEQSTAYPFESCPRCHKYKLTDFGIWRQDAGKNDRRHLPDDAFTSRNAPKDDHT